MAESWTIESMCLVFPQYNTIENHKSFNVSVPVVLSATDAITVLHAFNVLLI